MIKDSFKKEGNKYLVNSVIKKFCKENSIDSLDTRNEGIISIEDFANRSIDNKEKVDCWLDKVIKEGIKHIYISKISFLQESTLYKSELFWKTFSNKYDLKKVHINSDNSSRSLEYRGIEFAYNNGNISEVYIYLSVLYILPNDSHQDGDIEVCPIFVDINIDKKIVSVRIKSKTNQYKIKNGSTFQDKIDYDNKITNDKIVKEVMDKLARDIGFYRIDLKEFENEVYFAYFNILKEMTNTPEEIQEKIDKSEEMIEKYITELLTRLNIPLNYKESAKGDLRTLVEKFSAISYPDKSIFTENSFAFPVKLSATDSEETRIEESASNFEPLQIKGAFYDHKKIILSEEVCDGMRICVNRINKLYYGSEPFITKLDFRKGFARIRIEEYVEEEDIQNVLSRVISNL